MKSFLFPVLQSLFVALIVMSFYATSWFGEQFTIRAEPFDPFDPFYGEYVMLQYPDLKPTDSLQNGDVFFTLKEGEDGYARIDRVDTHAFFGSIHGTYYDNRITAPQLEQYYVEQGTGLDLEKARDLAVTLDVSPWGSIRPISLDVRQD